MNRIQTNVMAENAMSTLPLTTKATTAPNQPMMNPDLEWGIGVLQEFQRMSTQPPPPPDSADEIKRLRAERRLNASLRRLEIEQKAVLLAESQQKMAEARRIFESRSTTSDDGTSRFQSPIEDMFQAAKERQELMDMEREQKEELLKNTLESLRRDFGDNWQQILRNPETSRRPGRSSPINEN